MARWGCRTVITITGGAIILVSPNAKILSGKEKGILSMKKMVRYDSIRRKKRRVSRNKNVLG